MNRFLAVAAAATIAIVPLATLAQAPPPGAPPGMPRPHGSPSPEMKAAMERAHAAAREAAYGALRPDHRAAVQAIVGRVNSGSLTDVHAAAKQIDDTITVSEAHAAMSAAMKAMHAAMPGRGAKTGARPMGGGMTGHGMMAGHDAMGGRGMAAGGAGWRRGHGGRGGPGGAMHGHDPGMMLLMAGVDPAKARQLMTAEREQHLRQELNQLEHPAPRPT